MSFVKVEYIWIDGSVPTKRLCSKTRVCIFTLPYTYLSVNNIPQWRFDGSSTNRANTNNLDLILKPVKIFNNPIDSGMLVLCEVLNLDGSPHVSNNRNLCLKTELKLNEQEPLFGIEQEYFIFKGKDSITAEYLGIMPPEGRYFCGIGGNVSFGREIVQEHLDACIAAGISIEGINAEVAPGQWEFQIGLLPGVEVSDHLWVARWLLNRVAEKHGCWINYDAKPYYNYNGSGAHVNFSINRMRDSKLNCEDVCKCFESRCQEHLAVYGYNYQEHLTGSHETSSFNEFRYGHSDKMASICISSSNTFIKDRRPNANIDPYEVTNVIMETINLNLDFLNIERK